jgi:hypothetical protein
MRFTKSEILAAFEREDTSYRLAVLSTHWLRNTAPFKPSAADEARGLSMRAGGRRISYSDIADKLEQQGREAVVSDFILTQLHALIRAPLELLDDYCDDYDLEVPTVKLTAKLRAAPWYRFAKIVRNAVSHNFHYDFGKRDRESLPVTWNGITLTGDLQGQPVTYETFWHKPGYELFLEMRTFAQALPETPSREIELDRAS